VLGKAEGDPGPSCDAATRLFAVGTDDVSAEGFFPAAPSATIAVDRKLLVGGESLHQRLATGHHP